MSLFTDQVSASSDDASQGASGVVSTTATTNAMTTTAYVTWTGNRFLNVTIPNGATVSAADMSLDFSSVFGGLGVVNINCEDTATPATYATTTNDISSRTYTAESPVVSWTMPSTTGYHASTDISPVAQAVFALAGWASGNNLAIVTECSTSRASNNVNTYDNSTSTSAELSITYTASSTPGAPTIALANDATNPTTALDITITAGTGSPTGYDIQQASTIGGTFSTIATNVSSPYTVSGLTPGTEYAFQVAGVNGSGVGTYCSPAAWATAPAGPTGLSSAFTATTATVSFTPPVVGSTMNIQLYYSRYESPAGAGNWVNGPSGNSSPLTITGLSPNTQYGIELATGIESGNGDFTIALGGLIEGPWSSEVTGKFVQAISQCAGEFLESANSVSSSVAAEFESSVAAIHAAPADSLASIAALSQESGEWGSSARAIAAISADSLASIGVVEVAPSEWAGTIVAVQSIQTAAASWGVSVWVADQAVAEWGGSVTVVLIDVVPAEWGASVESVSQPAAAEVLKSVKSIDVSPSEFLASIAAASPVAVESETSVHATFVSPAEILSSLKPTYAVPAEFRGAIASTYIVAAESLASLAAEFPVVAEALTSIDASAAVPAEFEASLKSVSAPLAAEFLASARLAEPVAVESSGNLSVIVSAATEWESSVHIISPVPTDSLASVKIDPAVSAEFFKSVTGDYPSAAEFGASARYIEAAAAEFPGAVKYVSPAPAEILTSVHLAAPQPAEWRGTVVFVSPAVAAELLSSVKLENPAVAATLGTLAIITPAAAEWFATVNPAIYIVAVESLASIKSVQAACGEWLAIAPADTSGGVWVAGPRGVVWEGYRGQVWEAPPRGTVWEAQ